MIFQTMNNGAFQQPQQRQPGQQGQQVRGDMPPNPFEILGALLGNPTNGRQGDMVWSQEAFDRILEQLAEQNNASTAPGPASEAAIKSLPKRKVTKDMMGIDGTAECSICMDDVELGSDVTVLPCNHWFHGDCVVAWLKEHDTCPHCRKPITVPEEQPAQSSRRRSSRRPSSVATPFAGDGSRDRPYNVPDSPSAVREARQQYYGSRREPEDRPPNRRHSSSRHSSRSEPRGGGGGGVTGWFRNRMGI